MGQKLNWKKIKWEKHQVGQTSSKTNTKQWMGQTLNGKTLYQTNMELEKESSRTNIEWEKHQVGQTMRWTSNEWNIKWEKQQLGQKLRGTNIGWDK